jgi:hypothetical protein
MANTELFKYNKFYSTIEQNCIKNFTIYGERHCGTKWVEKSISERFNIPVTWEYDFKHFFGCCPWEKLNTANNTLFIGVVRNIYSWIRGMHRIPYHLESNNVLKIKPWKNIDGFCESHWYTKDLYKDIFDMRHNKNLFLYYYVPYLVNNFIFIRYEDLIIHHEKIMSTISDFYKLKQYSKKSHADQSKLYLEKLPKYYLEIINKNNNWNHENIIGYKKIASLPYEKTDYLL